MTSIVVLGSDTSPLMFKLEEIELKKNLFSLADKIVTFDHDGSKLIKSFQPLISLKVAPLLSTSWISPFVNGSVGVYFRQMIDAINQSQIKHQSMKDFNLPEDPWENYLFYDAQSLVKLICH
mmetsp:Transcript_6826/g.11519  ORF Transcript_6826/g.11519 Transcript_6826/m.11519 type:complete len:122 (+) Transcript_6826:1133-1498(+)